MELVIGKAFRFKKVWWQQTQKEIDNYFDDVLFLPTANIFRKYNIGIHKSLQTNELQTNPENRDTDFFNELSVFLTSAHANISSGHTSPNINANYDAVIGDAVHEINRTVHLSSDQFIPSSKVLNNLGEVYNKNLQEYVHKHSITRLDRMRRLVKNHMDSNGSLESLAKKFGQTYGINKRKSEFLARQETGLLITDVQKQRYQDVGVHHFEWLPSASIDKNHYHVTLYNRVFAFLAPPIIDIATGKRGLPKEWFGCDCGIQPVLSI